MFEVQDLHVKMHAGQLNGRRADIYDLPMFRLGPEVDCVLDYVY